MIAKWVRVLRIAVFWSMSNRGKGFAKVTYECEASGCVVSSCSCCVVAKIKTFPSPCCPPQGLAYGCVAEISHDTAAVPGFAHVHKLGYQYPFAVSPSMLSRRHRRRALSFPCEQPTFACFFAGCCSRAFRAVLYCSLEVPVSTTRTKSIPSASWRTLNPPPPLFFLHARSG